MQLGGFGLWSETKRRRHILHEFGHVLGLWHEHQTYRLEEHAGISVVSRLPKSSRLIFGAQSTSQSCGAP